MSQQELLTRVVQVLGGAAVDYMLTGSIVSSFQGNPRSTHDIDIVVQLPPSGVQALLAAFPAPRFYLDEASMRGAVARRDMFNLLDADSGYKVDFWMLTDDAFDRERFARKTAEVIDGLSVNVSRPEDTILMKLKWSRDSGGSAKQFLDAKDVYEVQFGVLDQDHLDRWARQLGVEQELARLRQEARPL
jgi:hypothetical protein